MDAQFNLFGSQFDESPLYFILLSPSAKISQIIKQYKEIADKYLQNNSSSNSFPHISLLQFNMSPKLEQTLKKTLKKYAPSFSSTPMISSKIQTFASSKAIYVSLKEQNEIQNICKLLFKDILLSGLTKKNKYWYDSTKNLHITIAKGLTNSQLIELEKLLVPIPHEDILFKCSSLKILKRYTDSDKWAEVDSFIL